MFIISSLVLQISLNEHWGSPAISVLADWSRPCNRVGDSLFSNLELLWGSEWQNCCLPQNHTLHFFTACRAATNVHPYPHRSWKQNPLAQSLQISYVNVWSNYPIFFKDYKQMRFSFCVWPSCPKTQAFWIMSQYLIKDITKLHLFLRLSTFPLGILTNLSLINYCKDLCFWIIIRCVIMDQTFNPLNLVSCFCLWPIANASQKGE